MTFEEWLVENDYTTNADNIYNEFSNTELETLYAEYESEGWCDI